MLPKLELFDSALSLPQIREELKKLIPESGIHYRELANRIDDGYWKNGDFDKCLNCLVRSGEIIAENWRLRVPMSVPDPHPETHEVEFDQDEVRDIIATHLHRDGYDVPDSAEIQFTNTVYATEQELLALRDASCSIEANFRLSKMSEAEQKQLRFRKRIVEEYLDNQTQNGWERMLLEIQEMDVFLPNKSVSFPEPEGVRVKIRLEDGFLDVLPHGYGELDATPGFGAPISIEMYKSELRVIVRPDINQDNPTVISLEGAKESNLKPDNSIEVSDPNLRKFVGIWPDGTVAAMNETEAGQAVDMSDCHGDFKLMYNLNGTLHEVTHGSVVMNKGDGIVYGTSQMLANGQVVGMVQHTHH